MSYAQQAMPDAVQRHFVYTKPLNPREYPDDVRRYVKPPTWQLFGNQTHFTTMRGFQMKDGKLVDYVEDFERYTSTFDLGDVIWPNCRFLAATNIPDMVQEMKRRNLFMYEVWGYVPGSGPGDWHQFTLSKETADLFISELGDKWLGMDMGEQDGRYLLGYSKSMSPLAANRFEQYLNFHRHISRIANDTGNRIIAPYLRQRGIKRLDEMVITHLHEDHAGGAPYLIRSFRPARFRTSYTPDHPNWRRLARELERIGAKIHSAGEGSQWSWGDVKVRALAPSPEQRWRGKPSNNDSLVLLVRFGRRSILLTGDIERGAADRLAGDGLLERVDVLKMPHHGAKSALSEPLLDATRPALALISAGWRNSFGFPHPATIQALRTRRAIPLRTDLRGTVTVRTNGVWLTYESHAESAL